MNPTFPLPGTICTQYIRCGKESCRCQQGQPHGPYYYRVWREGDKVFKRYVPPAELEAVQAQCDAYKAVQDRLRRIRQERQALSKRIGAQCRTAQRLLRPGPVAARPVSPRRAA